MGLGFPWRKMIDAIHSVLMVAAGDELYFMLKINLHGSAPSPHVVFQCLSCPLVRGMDLLIMLLYGLFYAVLHQFLMCKVWSIVLRMKIEVSHQSSKLILVSLQWVRIEFGASASSFGSVWQGTNLLVQQALRTHHKYNCKYRINPLCLWFSHWMSYFHQYGAEKDALVSHDSLSGSFHVVLPSGRSVILTLSMNSTVSEIRDAAKDALQVNFLRLMCLDWTCDHVILMQMESKCNYASWNYIYNYNTCCCVCILYCWWKKSCTSW